MLIDSDGSKSKHVASKPNPEHVEDKEAQENEGGGYWALHGFEPKV
jgi:hypothetical protein